MNAEETLRGFIDRFNERARNDPELAREIAGMDKKAVVDLTTEVWSFHLRDGQVHDLQSGAIENPDITITTDQETFEALVDGRIKPMKAFALRKVRIKGDIDDILRLRKLF